MEVTYELALHRNKEVIFIHFDYDPSLNERVKKLVGVRWSSSKKAWYVLDCVHYRQKFGLVQKQIGKEALENISPINQQAIKKYIETLQLKAYSPNTITTYRNEFLQLLYLLKEKNVDELTVTRLRVY